MVSCRIFPCKKEVFTRGRNAAPIEGIEQYDFDQLVKTEGNPRERRRYLAFAHLREGKTFTDTAIAVRVQLRSLMRWVKRFKAEGLEGLKDKPGRGAKRFLPEEHQAAFREAVLELQANRTGGRIRGRDVLELMKNKYGIDPSLNTIVDPKNWTGELVYFMLHKQLSMETKNEQNPKISKLQEKSRFGGPEERQNPEPNCQPVWGPSHSSQQMEKRAG